MKKQLFKQPVTIALIVFFLPFLNGQVWAQEKLKARIADDYFLKYSFVEAATIYQDLAMKNSKNTHYVSRTAECYRLTGNIEKAAEWYGKLASMENVNIADILMYAHMLEGNKKYDEAQQYFGYYNERGGTDSRGKRKAVSDEKPFKSLYKDSAYFRVENLSINSESADFGLVPFGEKTFFFASNRKNEKEKYVKHIHNWNNQPFLDLYTVKKNDSDAFLAPTTLPGEVNSQYHEGPVFFDKNSNTFYITRNNYNDKNFQKSEDGVNKLKIYIVNIDGTANKSFGEFEHNNNEYSVGHATLSNDGQRLYFSSDMPGGFGGSDIYVSLKEGEKWGMPKNVGSELNTEGNEMFPYISPDDKLYFSSNGQFGLGGLDIYVAELKNGSFTHPKNMGYPVNSNKDDFAFYISDDNINGNFSSNREGGKGDDDIYSFTILKKHYFIAGKALDKANAAVLASTKITLTDAGGNTVTEFTTADDGSYKFEINPAQKYTLKGNKENYFDGMNTFATNESQTEYVADVLLEAKPALLFSVLILDKATGRPIENANLIVTDKNDNSEFMNVKTPESGGCRKPLEDRKIGDRLSYEIKIEKEGYLGKTVNFTAEISHPGEIKVQETLDKIEIGADIGKIIDIRPIYFDLAKWKIRKDASAELDKIVKVLNENLTMTIELGSHTDCRSGSASNMTLSDKRAQASAEYIKKKIIGPERIYGKGYGESQLVNKCECEGIRKIPCTEEEHQMNRRTEFKVIKM